MSYLALGPYGITRPYCPFPPDDKPKEVNGKRKFKPSRSNGGDKKPPNKRRVDRTIVLNTLCMIHVYLVLYPG